MRTSAQRNDQYVAKTDPATVGLKVAARLPSMKTDFAAVTNELVQAQACTLDVLNEDAIPRIKWGRYFAFCNEMFRLTTVTDVAGPLAIAETDALVAKWVAFGCLLPTVTTIAFNCFNITVTPV